MNRTPSSRSAGFTLVEAMVAISILALSITGPLTIAQKGIASATYSRDQVTAFYLAQEAVEYIRNARDTNGNNGVDWMTSMGECLAQMCTIDARYAVTHASALSTFATENTPLISRNTSTSGASAGLYGYDASTGWTPTIFRRTVSITPVGGDNKEVVVSVKILWNSNLFSPQKQFSVKEVLFNI